MPAPPDSPMAKDMWDRLNLYAEADSEREDDAADSRGSGFFTFWLSGGHIFKDCQLSDGVNGLDDQSVEVTVPGADAFSTSLTIAIAHIAAFSYRFPPVEGAAPPA